MSYTQLINGSSPLGYWKLNGDGVAQVGVDADIQNPEWTSLPLVVGSEKALVVKKNGASVSIGYDIDQFRQGYEWKTLSIEFWLAFNNIFDGNGYQNNLSDDTRYFTDNKLSIIRMMNDGFEFASIYYDYDRNTLRFSVVGENSDAYIPIRNLNSIYYVVATYSNGVLSICVNGIDGVTGAVKEYIYLPLKNDTLSINIDGDSNLLADKGIVISDLALYDYKLTINNMKQRVLLAFDADKPVALTKTLGTSYFDLSQKEYQIAFYEKLTKNDFSADVFKQNNVSMSYDEGITADKVNKFRLVSYDGTGEGSLFDSVNNGLLITSSSNHLVFDNYSDIFGKYTYKTISMQIVPLQFPFTYELFSIKNIVAGKDLVVRVSDTDMSMLTFDPQSASYSEIFKFNLSGSIDSPFNLGLSFEKNGCYVFMNEENSYVDITGFDFMYGRELIVGPSETSDISTSSVVIKNFGMNNSIEQSFIDYDFTENKMLMARFNQRLDISQMSIWKKIINFSNYNNIKQTSISWDGMDNCSVQISEDDITWTDLKKNQSIPNIKYNASNADRILKISVPFNYEKELKNQSFNHIEYAFYRDLSIYSDDRAFVITQEYEDESLPSYSIKRIPQTISMRQNNIGIKFEKTNDVVNGYALIKSMKENYSVYAIDFWCRFDDTPNGFLDISTKVTAPDSYIDIYIDSYDQGVVSEKYGLWFDAGGYLNSSSTVGSVFVNGQPVNSGEYQAVVGEYFHVAVVLDVQAKDIQGIYINGYLGGNTEFHSNATYGHINIWQNQVSDLKLSSRYTDFIDKRIFSIDDANTNFWQSDWNNDSITTIFAFKTG